MSLGGFLSGFGAGRQQGRQIEVAKPRVQFRPLLRRREAPEPEPQRQGVGFGFGAGSWGAGRNFDPRAPRQQMEAIPAPARSRPQSEVVDLSGLNNPDMGFIEPGHDSGRLALGMPSRSVEIPQGAAPPAMETAQQDEPVGLGATQAFSIPSDPQVGFRDPGQSPGAMRVAGDPALGFAGAPPARSIDLGPGLSFGEVPAPERSPTSAREGVNVAMGARSGTPAPTGPLQVFASTRAEHSPSTGLNISMDFNAAPGGGARGTEVIIPDDASPEVRAAAERFNQMVADFAAQHGYADYPVRGVRTRSENGRGVSNTVHTEPFFNDDLQMQQIIQENPEAFAAIYREAFGDVDGRLIAPHGVGNDRGAASDVFGTETDYGMLMANSLLSAPAPGGSTDPARLAFSPETTGRQVTPPTTRVADAGGQVATASTRGADPAGEIDWVEMQGPDGSPIWVSRDYLRDAEGNYVRGSIEAAAPYLEQYGARLPQSVDEIAAINASAEMMPFLASGGGPTGAEGGFAGQYPSADNYDDLVALHNEALAAQDFPTAGVIAGHLKDLLGDGSLYHPDQGLQGAHRSDPTYRDYSQGIRLIRTEPPETAAASPQTAGRTVTPPAQGEQPLAATASTRGNRMHGSDLVQPPEQFRDIALEAATQYGLDPGLFNALVFRESTWRPEASSRVGAFGLTQAMPNTARQPGYGVAPMSNPNDPVEQLRFGAEYLSAMIRHYDGDTRRALVAYNWGPGNANRWDGNLSSLPRETRDYVQFIEANSGGATSRTYNSAPAREAPAAREAQPARRRTPHWVQRFMGRKTR